MVGTGCRYSPYRSSAADEESYLFRNKHDGRKLHCYHTTRIVGTRLAREHTGLLLYAYI